MSKVVHASGKRKRSIARVTIKEGKGFVRVNKRLLDTFTNDVVKLRIQEPLIIAGNYAKKVNIDVNVKGGGFQGQADAIRLAIAKGFVKFTGDDNLKKDYLNYDRQLLVADIRRKEPRKPGDSKARAKRQKSYR